MYLPFSDEVKAPVFKPSAKNPRTDGSGFTLYYTDQCPFTSYWVSRTVKVAEENGIPLKTVHVTDRETAQNLSSPVTTYALFKDGKFFFNEEKTNERKKVINKKFNALWN